MMDYPAKLAGIGIGNSVLNMVPYTLLVGVNTALETLVSQAYGRGNLHECGLQLHRAMFLILCLFIPIAASFFWADNFLINFGIDVETSAYARTYLTLLLPSVLLNSLGDSIDLFLISMRFNHVVCLMQLIVVPIHLVTCWAFVYKLNLGIEGAALANNITAILTFSCQLVFVARTNSIERAWSLPTKDTFRNLGPFMKLALPGTLMLVLQNSSMEVLVLLAGLLHNVEILTA